MRGVIASLIALTGGVIFADDAVSPAFTFDARYKSSSIPNWWEARFSRNGSKTSLDASTDDDANGMSNYGEFVVYTNRRR